jgi:protein TonB
MVAAAIAATAMPPRSAAPIEDPHPIFVPVPVPVAPPQPREVVPSPSSTAPAPLGTPSLPTVVEIPIGLPAIDLGRPVTTGNEFMGGPRGRPDGTGESGATGPGVASSVFTDAQVDKPVLLRPGARVPSYPEMLRGAGIAGTVIVEFVVDTLGRIEPGSMRTVQADHDLFSSAVERVMPTLRFIPAEAAGRKVRQLVRLPFRFDLHSL